MSRVAGRMLRLAAALLTALSTGHGATAVAGAPQTDYMLQCMGCHLADGSGAPGKVPSLSDMGRFLTVPGGREYLVRVPGVSQSSLGDAEIAAVMNWMLVRFSANSLPGDFEPYTAEEVAGSRAEPLTDVSQARARLIEQLRDSQHQK